MPRPSSWEPWTVIKGSRWSLTRSRVARSPYQSSSPDLWQTGGGRECGLFGFWSLTPTLSGCRCWCRKASHSTTPTLRGWRWCCGSVGTDDSSLSNNKYFLSRSHREMQCAELRPHPGGGGGDGGHRRQPGAGGAGEVQVLFTLETTRGLRWPGGGHWRGCYQRGPRGDWDRDRIQECLTGIISYRKLHTSRSIVAFRHGHKFNFDCSDIYIIVALRPTTTQIKFDEREISACQWMPIQVKVWGDELYKALSCLGVHHTPSGSRYKQAHRREIFRIQRLGKLHWCSGYRVESSEF